MILKKQQATSAPATDPYAYWVQALFHWNNAMTNTGARASEPMTEGSTWNVFGAQVYNSKPTGGANTFIQNSPFGGTNYSYNFGGVRRLNYANYDAFPMYANFTWESWVYLTSTSTDQYVFGRGDGGTGGTVGSYIRINSGGAGLNVWYQNSTVVTTSTSGLFTTGQWYHVAVTRSGSTWRTFVNGVLDGTGTSSNTDIPSVQSTIGGDLATNTFLSGYMADFRFTAPICRYTANFTPPTTAFPNYVVPTNTVTSDPYWGNVVTMLHMDNATNNGTTFTDSSTSAVTISRSISAGVTNMAVTSTTAPRWGASSGLMNSGYGTTGANITLPSNAGYAFSTGDFTIDMWAIRNGNVKAAYVFSCGATSLEMSILTGTNKGRVSITYNGTEILRSTDGILSDGYWKQVSIVRSSGTIYLFMSGLLQASASFSTSLDISGMIIGRRTTSDVTGSTGTGGTTWCGNIDDFRVTNGVARYTSDYTVPAGAYPNTA